MTDQMFVFLCADVKKHAYDYRRGELHDVEERKFEEHLSACESCQDYYARLEGMLDAALIQEMEVRRDRDQMFMNIVAAAREPSDDAKRDELFAKISEEIDRPVPAVSAEALAMVAGDGDADDEADVAPGRSPVALYVAAALAAGVLIGFGLQTLYSDAPAPARPEMVAHQTTAQPEVEQPATNAAPKVEIASVTLAELRPQPSPDGVEDVHVFGSEDASWQLRTQGAGRTMAFDAGTVLVEYLPGKRGALTVVGEGFDVEVTGTIFYVSSEPTTVGVVEGSVQVREHDGEVVELLSGDEWSPTEGRHRAQIEVRRDVERHINVEGHNAALEAARAEATPKPPRPALSKEVVRTPRAELRASAEAALKEKRYAVAAQFYERMVEELPATLPENASLRLDLARIYLRHLGNEKRAMSHLRRFVNDRPGDPLTPVARDELCRIASSLGSKEPGCSR